MNRITMPKTAPWVVGATLASLVIIGLVWMFGISPQLDAASQARADADMVELQNIGHAARLDLLREQSEHLDEYKAELAAIAVQIPPEDGEPAFLREIDRAATATGAFIVKVTTEAATVVAPPAEAAATDPNAGATAPTDEAAEPAPTPEGGATEEPPAEVEPVPMGIDGFVAIPFTITVLGSYDKTVAFVEAAQQSFQRLFVVTGFTVKGQPASPPAGGRPEVQEGDAEFEINGFVYVLQDVDQVAETQPDADPTSGEVVDS